MGSWQVKGPVKGLGGSWRDKYPDMRDKLERIKAPVGRGIAWEGAEIWAYRNRPRGIIQVFRENVRQHPDKEAFVFHPGGQRLTWGETSELVDRMAYRLRHQYGFRKGDRMGLLMMGGPEFVISYLASAALGGIAVPINLGLPPDGIAIQINKVRARHLVVSPPIWQGKVQPVADRLSGEELVFITGDQSAAGGILFSSLVDEPVPEVVTEETGPWDLCAISFTSGTTGSPKGTMAMNLNVLGCVQAFVDCMGMTRDDAIICMPPLFHNTAVYANFLPAVYMGVRLVVMASFNPLEALQLIDREKATMCVAAPVMLLFMMNHPERQNYDLSSLKRIGFGGHAASESFINQLFQVFQPTMALNGGSVSENTALGFALPMEDAIRKITSCGLATPNTEIALFDENGHEILTPGVIGEVAYKGQQTNAGYWEEPEKTAETFRSDGYVLSGDWAKIDDEGYLWLLDRKKDMVVRGGQNVYCIEVENKIYLNDKVLSAAVLGVPDHLFAERIKAVIVPRPGRSLTAEEVREHCLRHLTHYEIPEYVVFTTALPTNPSGKTLKRKLVDYWGQPEDAPDAGLAVLKAYCGSLPDKLMDVKMFHLNGVELTPREAMVNLEQGTETGVRLRTVIEGDGLVQLLKPDEARFRSV
ncbi:MAG: AMP-binding protein [Proteobacteria bacterium]|nr:AMP-binding protein [Pseudomonadota bacterium]